MEIKLSDAERNAVKIFLLEESLPQPQIPQDALTSSNFADNVLANKRRRVESNRYRSTLHFSATSNICERLFSNARLIMNHLRACMDPDSCEMLLFLKYNYRFWSNPMIIDVILAENDPDLDDVASRESDEEALPVIMCVPVYCTVVIIIYYYYCAHYDTIILFPSANIGIVNIVLF